MGIRRAVAAYAAVLLLALAARAADVVDLEVGVSDRVVGTLRPADDRENLFVAALRGSSVRATVRRKGASDLTPAVELVDASLATVAAGTPSSSGATLRVASLAATGGHRFRVTGNGDDGDYKLDVSVRPLRRWTAASEEDLAPGAETTFAFAAPAGATATFDIRAAKRSPFRARLVSVTGPSGAVTDLTSDDPVPEPVLARDRAAVTLGPAGEHVLRFRNVGDAAGPWTLSVRLKFANPPRRTVDLRDEALAGEFGGTQGIFGRFAGGASDVTIDGGLNLDGVSILVPAGALPVPGVISMSEIDPFFVSDQRFAAGTTVSFLPSGTTFSVPAQVTVPIDLDSFDDPLNEVSIVVEDAATGTQETIPASSVDAGNGTATFPVSHFSRFQPTSPNPRPLRGNFVDLELTGRTTPGYGTEITFGRNGVNVGAKQGLGSYRLSTALRTIRRTTIAWSVDKAGDAVLSARYDERLNVAGTAQTNGDGVVEVVAPDGLSATLERGRGAESLASVETVPDGLRIHAMLRKAKGLPTPANLAGGWHATVFEVEARTTLQRTVAASLTGQEFDLVVDARGTAAGATAATTSLQQVFPTTAWREDRRSRAIPPGRLRPDGADAVLDLRIGAATLLPASVRLAPVLGGDVLVGAANTVAGDQAAPTGAAFRVVVLVRHASKATAASLPANAILASFTAAAAPAGDGTATLRFSASRGGLTFTKDGAARFTGLRRQAGHDAQGLATFTQAPLLLSGTARVDDDGRYDAGKGVPRGFLAPTRGTIVLSAPAAGGVSLGVALPSRPPTE